MTGRASRKRSLRLERKRFTRQRAPRAVTVNDLWRICGRTSIDIVNIHPTILCAFGRLRVGLSGIRNRVVDVLFCFRSEGKENDGTRIVEIDLRIDLDRFVVGRKGRKALGE